MRTWRRVHAAPLTEGLSGYPSPQTRVSTRTSEAVLRHRWLALPPNISDSGAWVGLRMDILTDSCLSRDHPLRRPPAHPPSSQTVLLAVCAHVTLLLKW